MIAGCYALDLYCDNYDARAMFNITDRGEFQDEWGHVWDEFPRQYTDELGSVCRRRARLAGWLLKKDGRALCPKCVARGVRL